MNYLLDTCVASELIKPAPDAGLLAWLAATGEGHLFLSAVTVGEIQQGISRLPDGARKQRLQAWLDDDLRTRFDGRIVSCGIEEWLAWGQVRGALEAEGRPVPVLDALIAVSCITRNLVLVTRNLKDMERIAGVRCLNPWAG